MSDYYANGSFWCSYPNKSFKQRPGRAVKAENGKIYVSVVFSDGDNVQFDQNALYAIWTDDTDRGLSRRNYLMCRYARAESLPVGMVLRSYESQ